MNTSSSCAYFSDLIVKIDILEEKQIHTLQNSLLAIGARPELICLITLVKQAEDE